MKFLQVSAIAVVVIFNCFSLIMSKPLEENVIDSNHETLERHVRQCPFGGGGGGAFGGAGAQNGIPGFPGNQNPLGGQQGFPGQQQPQQNLPFTLG